MSNVQLFDFKAHQIRVVEINGDPWFVAVDVCSALGLSTHDRGSYHALRGLDETQRKVVNTPRQGRGNPNVTVISESGLYKLVMRSDKPSYC